MPAGPRTRTRRLSKVDESEQRGFEVRNVKYLFVHVLQQYQACSDLNNAPGILVGCTCTRTRYCIKIPPTR